MQQTRVVRMNLFANRNAHAVTCAECMACKGTCFRHCLYLYNDKTLSSSNSSNAAHAQHHPGSLDRYCQWRILLFREMALPTYERHKQGRVVIGGFPPGGLHLLLLLNMLRRVYQVLYRLLLLLLLLRLLLLLWRLLLLLLLLWPLHSACNQQ